MIFPAATLDADALRHNLAVVRSTASNSRVLAVIKANAYGHGLIEAARALNSADALGVARIGEGLALRAAGVEGNVLLLEGVFSADELGQAARAKFELVVHEFKQVELLEQASASFRFTVWIKLNTGMNRLGFTAEQFQGALTRLKACACVGRIRLMTHLAGAEESGGESARRQIEKFQSLTVGIAAERSIANSAGVLGWPEAHLDWVRPGLMLYGLSPIADRDGSQLGLRSVMTLTTQLIAVRRVPKGEGVGYNAIWKAPRDSHIGIAAVGYGDGYARNVRSGAPVLVSGHRAKVAGRVSMDMTAIDVTDVPDAKVGDEVVLWGNGVPAETVAPFADTISYELVCGITQRVARVWKGSGKGESEMGKV